jgi:hypothetical protein
MENERWIPVPKVLEVFNSINKDLPSGKYKAYEEWKNRLPNLKLSLLGWMIVFYNNKPVRGSGQPPFTGFEKYVRKVCMEKIIQLTPKQEFNVNLWMSTYLHGSQTALGKLAKAKLQEWAKDSKERLFILITGEGFFFISFLISPEADLVKKYYGSIITGEGGTVPNDPSRNFNLKFWAIDRLLKHNLSREEYLQLLKTRGLCGKHRDTILNHLIND